MMDTSNSSFIGETLRMMANESRKVIHEALRTIADNRTSSDVTACMVIEAKTFAIFICLVALPLHIMLCKILLSDFQFNLPRHKILFSLSVSDAALVLGMFISCCINTVITIPSQSTGCFIYRGFTMFYASSTLVVSTLSITALSVERYVACIHSFHLHEILTESRVRYGSIIVWSLGLLSGIVVTITSRYDVNVVVPSPSPLHYVFPVSVIPSSIVILTIQVRLFLFSRTKMNSVIPVGAFGAELELAHYRKKLFKVAFMASIVAFAFILCTIPLAVVFLCELFIGGYVPSPTRPICIALLVSNSLADPLIYGFGMADTRKMIFRNLKNLKQLLIDMLPDKCLPMTRGNQIHPSNSSKQTL